MLMTSTKVRLQHRHRRIKALGFLTVGAGLAWIAFARQRSASFRALAPRPVRRSITIAVPPEQVYAFWRDLENLPSFMPRMVSIEPIDSRRSHWRARGPAGKLLEWDAEIVEEIPNELIKWQSLPASAIRHQGSVRFRPAPGSRGTEVSLEVKYEAPAGELGRWIASMTGPAMGVHLENDLRRLKQILEVGQVVRSDASAHPGLHPARPEPVARLAQKGGEP